MMDVDDIVDSMELQCEFQDNINYKSGELEMFMVTTPKSAGVKLRWYQKRNMC